MATSSQVLGPTDALTLLLTVESLLIAALAIGVSLATPRSGGSPPFIARGTLALIIAVVITLVGIGAAAAWIVAYIEPGPQGIAEWLEGLALAAGILGGVVFSWAFWYGVR